MLPALVLTTLPVSDPFPVPCMLNVPAPRSVRFPTPENVPARLVTVPVLAPFRVHVAFVALSVPVPVSSCFLIVLQQTLAMFAALAAVAGVVVVVPLIVVRVA